MAKDDRTLGFLGLGAMGTGMASRLASDGYGLRVYNRTPAKAAPLVATGATATQSAAQAVQGVATVIISLADEPAVEEVLFRDAARSLAAGTIVIDTSTVSPAFSRDAARRLARMGACRVEACLVGNPGQASRGELRILAAGEQADLRRVRDVLDVIGRDVLYLGPAGSAAAMKLVLNMLIGAEIAALAEAVAFGQAAGLTRDQILSYIAESGISSKVMSFRSAIMRERRYEPAAFRTALMAKDLRHAIDEAGTAAVRLPLTERVLAIVGRAVEEGAGAKDLAVLAEFAG
jgi:3-hydroxyisobutyrate dehydrogenase-like beta-hydroxyacid dehydrogenase